MVFIYILQLRNNKYYVGKTNNPKFRLDQHFNTTTEGSFWTKYHKPIKVLEIIPDCDNFDEDKYTLKCMEKYGINNVRGGSFCEKELSKTNLSIIKKMISGSTDKCYICGSDDHFAKDCHDDYDKLMDRLMEKLVDHDLCFRCHRKGHYASECYAKTTKAGDYLETSSEEESTEEDSIKELEESIMMNPNNRAFFRKSQAKKVHDTRIATNYRGSGKKIVCYRCGRDSHYSTDCYASKHVNGYYID